MAFDDVGATGNHSLSEGSSFSSRLVEVLEHCPGFPMTHHLNHRVINLGVK